MQLQFISLLISLFLITSVAFASPKAVVDQTQEKAQSMSQKKENEKGNQKKPIIATRTSPEISFKLKANPSTGYSWFLMNYDKNLLKPLSAKYNPPEKNMPGAPGYMLWRFRVNASAFVVPRATKIELLYARPWELAKGHQKKIDVIIH